MARKYEIWRCARCGGKLSCDCEPAPIAEITAIDERDVEPLLDALRYIEGQDVGGMEAHQRPTDVARAALKAFEAEEDPGG